jgi:phosphoglycolate phosphatase-like HAD superfamily hydrolase
MGLSVLDIDGVLADVRHRLTHVHRRPKDWDAFFAAAPDDTPLPEGLSRASELAARGDIIYLTGRPERCRLDTETWLDTHGFPDAIVLMRPDTDRRPARVFKLEEVKRLSTSATIDLVVDDDALVIDTLRAAGFPVEHAEWMPETQPQQASLFEAQEREGRT